MNQSEQDFVVTVASFAVVGAMCLIAIAIIMGVYVFF